MRHFVLFLSVSLVSGCAAQARDADVLSADAERRAAQVAADPEALGRILHERLVYRHSDGRAKTKDDLIESLTVGGVDYREIRIREIVEIGCADASRRCVRALQTLELTVEGRELSVSNCYVAGYAGSRLQLVAYRSAALDDGGGCPL